MFLWGRVALRMTEAKIESLKKRLRALTESANCIETCSLWLLHHKKVLQKFPVLFLDRKILVCQARGPNMVWRAQKVQAQKTAHSTLPRKRCSSKWPSKGQRARVHFLLSHNASQSAFYNWQGPRNQIESSPSGQYLGTARYLSERNLS